MSQLRFTLSWDTFHQQICKGLGDLQQNEDLVDMTLAADGHFVKVHQLVLSLASPYLKDLIKSAPCQNPVIFLNKISISTLSSILEYIYTGQVDVAKENIEELIEAGKALHIRGLMDMSYQLIISDNWSTCSSNLSGSQSNYEATVNSHDVPLTKITDHGDDSMGEPSAIDDATDTHTTVNKDKIREITDKGNEMKTRPEDLQIQYSLSNHGNLQMILNRFIYLLRYSSKTGNRQWRCIDYNDVRCPATAVTKGDVVLKRTLAHIHPYHDKKIARKIRENAIFSVISEAEKEGNSFKAKPGDSSNEIQNQ